MKSLLKKQGSLSALVAILAMVAFGGLAHFASADVTNTFWNQTSPNVLMTNTGNGLANADIHVAHCYIGTGTSVSCGGGGGGTIGGTISSPEVAYANGSDTITGDSNFTATSSSFDVSRTLASGFTGNLDITQNLFGLGIPSVFTGTSDTVNGVENGLVAPLGSDIGSTNDYLFLGNLIPSGSSGDTNQMTFVYDPVSRVSGWGLQMEDSFGSLNMDANTVNGFILNNGSDNTFTVDQSGTATVQKLDVGGHYALPTADGTADQVLETDGSGNVTWQTPAAPVGTLIAWTDVDGNANSSFGQDALSNTASGGPGYDGGYADTAVGTSALAALGSDSGSGGQYSRDTALGTEAGGDLVSGTEDTFLGYQAGIGSENDDNDLSDNVVVGSDVDVSNTSDETNANTLIGQGNSIDSASNNILVGQDSGVPSGTEGSITLGNSTDAASGTFAVGSNNFPIYNVELGEGTSNLNGEANISVFPTPVTGTNIFGSNMGIEGGASTGNANGGDLNFQVTPPGASGSGQNSPFTSLLIAGDGAHDTVDLDNASDDAEFSVNDSEGNRYIDWQLPPSYNPIIDEGDLSDAGNGTQFLLDDGAQSIVLKSNGPMQMQNTDGYRFLYAASGGLPDVSIGDIDDWDEGLVFTVSDTNDQYQFNGANFSIASVPYTFPFSQGGANTVLTNDGSGNLSWQTPASGAIAVFSTTTGSTVGVGPGSFNIVFNTGTGASTVNLDGSDPVGDIVIVSDAARQALTYNITVDAGTGQTITSTVTSAQTTVMNLNGQVDEFQRISSTQWMQIK